MVKCSVVLPPAASSTALWDRTAPSTLSAASYVPASVPVFCTCAVTSTSVPVRISPGPGESARALTLNTGPVGDRHAQAGGLFPESDLVVAGRACLDTEAQGRALPGGQLGLTLGSDGTVDAQRAVVRARERAGVLHLRGHEDLVAGVDLPLAGCDRQGADAECRDRAVAADDRGRQKGDDDQHPQRFVEGRWSARPSHGPTSCRARPQARGHGEWRPPRRPGESMRGADSAR